MRYSVRFLPEKQTNKNNNWKLEVVAYSMSADSRQRATENAHAHIESHLFDLSSLGEFEKAGPILSQN